MIVINLILITLLITTIFLLIKIRRKIKKQNDEIKINYLQKLMERQGLSALTLNNENVSDHLEPVVIPVVAFEEEIPAHLIEPIEDSSSLVVIEDTSDHLEPVVIPVVAFEEEIPAHLIEPIEDSSSLVVIEGVSDSNSLEVDSANLLNNLEKLLGNTYEINYLDSKNKLSCRQVTVKKIHQDNGALYIKTYCHLSRAPRTFRIDRIVGDVINIDTGELTSLV